MGFLKPRIIGGICTRRKYSPVRRLRMVLPDSKCMVRWRAFMAILLCRRSRLVFPPFLPLPCDLELKINSRCTTSRNNARKTHQSARMRDIIIRVMTVEKETLTQRAREITRLAKTTGGFSELELLD
jgi:hypothetical protein